MQIRSKLDYGHGSAPKLTDAERVERREIVDQIVDALIAVTTIARAGTAWAIDATGQWAWSRGPRAPRAELQAHLDAGKDDDELLKDLEVAGIHIEDDGMSAPAVQQPAPAGLRGRCLDAAWGYKTGKNGKKETGYGFHQHTMVRVADPNAASDSEPKLVDALVITPANSHFVEPSLRMIDRLRRRHTITLLIGDGLYNNPTADTWAVPLAQRGIDQSLAMRQGDWGVVDIEGAQMQHGWMHCPRAPMHRRPRPPSTPDEPLTDETIEAIEEFKYNWAFDRKVSGLGASLTSKWICPALAGRVGCHARPDTIPDAMAEGRPIVVPPEDWTSRKCCTGNTLIFTPDPTNKHHQRRIAQRHYVGTRKWRKARKRRPQIEGVFGVLKNPSRQRMRRGHNRLPGLALASIIAGIKVALYNEEELRTWHHATGLGPSDHPLLQDDPEYHGFRHLEAVEAEAIDLHHLRGDGEDPALTLVAA
jgi:hypothetical protein